jgi:hypothetical protein
LCSHFAWLGWMMGGPFMDACRMFSFSFVFRLFVCFINFIVCFVWVLCEVSLSVISTIVQLARTRFDTSHYLSMSAFLSTSDMGILLTNVRETVTKFATSYFLIVGLILHPSLFFFPIIFSLIVVRTHKNVLIHALSSHKCKRTIF